MLRITMVRSFLVRQGSLKVKRHDVILTNLKRKTQNKEKSLEDGGQSTVDELKEVNLGTIEEPRSTFISASLSTEEEGKYMSLLIKYKDIFAWSYKEMPGLDSKVAIHHVAIKPGYRPIKIMVDATTGHEALSFMDGSSGYNKIRMALLDEEMIAFRTSKGIYCYKMMPFGLKNASTTYQRAMQKVFDDMLHKYVECYVDDLVVKSKRRQDHLKDLKVVLDCLRKYQLRMNPLKCTFVHLVAKADPIKYVLSRPIISGRLAKWAVLLQQYDIVYIPKKALKGQALAEFLAEHLIPSDWKLCEDLPDDEALIIGLQMALEIGVSLIEIYGDSKLIINQLLLQYDVKHEDLKPYFTYAQELMERFDSVMLEHVPRTENKRVDALANLATSLTMPDDVALNIPLFQQWIMPLILSECQEANITTSHLFDEED
ncbi:hypothetical protein E6C27_scaffold79G001920 [Cucumis melo var. makuwa]|uniref:Reverse transcriptase domain-containing protein n=1 Tax=Cucumis melo var. makuwa TaxID=1194695 RepID=A0A5A7V370_CUCMM|nr:hypothetical protein E6C27_scaffold79G001920 [Cucumis melo var. makuwa]